MEYSQQLRPEELADLLPWLEALARQLVRDPGTAADLAQETLLVATASADSRTGSLRAWLRGVLSNRARRHRRSESRRRERERTAARSESQPADQALERAELAQHLLGRLLAQPEPYRSTLVEHFLEGSPLAEIARRKRLPAATVRSHAMRGLARLRSELEAERGQGEPGLALALAPLAGAGAPASTAGAASALPVFAKGSYLPRLGAAALLAALCGVALLALKLQAPSSPTPRTSDFALEPLASAEDPDILVAGAEVPQVAERASAAAALDSERSAALPSVGGIVRDLEGRPIPGATVLWTTDGQYAFPIDSVRAPEPGREPFSAQRTETGGQGRFRFPNPGVGPLRLAVSAPGYSPFASTEFRILETGAVTLDPIVLSAGQTLTCRILSPSGEGVAGAAIDLEYERDAGFFASDARAYRPLGKSGPDGTFRSDSLPAGPVRLRATHPEHLAAFGQTTVPTPPGAPFTLAFPAATFIEGRVLGVPSHKALSISYRGNPKTGSGPAPRREHHSGKVPVEEDGSFRIPVPAEPKGTAYRLSPVLAPHNMAHPWADPQDVYAGTTGVLFAEPNHAILKLRVVDGSTGTGLADAQLNLTRGHLGGSDLVHHRRVHSTGPGDYVIQPVMVIQAEYPQQLLIRAPGYVSAVIGIPVLSKGGTTDLGVIELRPAAGRTVLVSDEQGQPVANAEVVLQVPGALSSREAVEAFGPGDSGSPGRGPWQPSTRSASTGEDGIATLYPPDQGEFLIHATADGFAPEAPVEIAQGPGTIELTLRPGATLEILLQDPEGSPVAGQKAFLSMEDPSKAGKKHGASLHREGYSDRSGLVSFAHLPAGTASITVDRMEASAEVPMSGTTRTSVTCTPLATPSGIVRLGGEPLAGAELTLMASTDEGSYEVGSTTAAGDGSFSFPLSPCGPMHLDARHPSFPLGLWTAFALDEQGTPWELDLTADAVTGRLTTDDGGAPTGAIAGAVHASEVASAVRVLARLRAPKFSSFSLATLDGSGSFRLEGLPCNADLVLVAVDKTHAVTALPLRLDPGTPRDGLRFQLQPASTLLIDVDLTGLPVQQGYVPCYLTLIPTAGPALATGRRHGQPKADGKARFDRLPPGTWVLETKASRPGDDRPSPQTVIELKPGETRKVEVTALQ